VLTADQSKLVEDNIEVADQAVSILRRTVPLGIESYLGAEEAQGVAREALCRAAEKWNGEASFSGYAMVTIRFALIDWLRACGVHSRRGTDRRTVPWVADGDMGPNGALIPTEARLPEWMHSPSPEKEVIGRDFVRDCFSILTTREREVMTKHYIENKTTSEIAKTLGVSDGRITQLFASSLHKIRSRCNANHSLNRRA
jgi:RNA polymerase sigma factor (sigma-70 family)